MLSLAVKFKNAVKRLVVRDEQGTSAVEYGILASLIAIVIIGAVTNLGTTLSGVFTNVVTALKG